MNATNQTARRILRIAALTAVCGLPLSAAAQNCDFLNPPAVTDDPDAAGIDSNGDGIDGMACGPIFVSPFGIDSDPGTKDQPMRTVAAAVVAAALYSPPRDVYVASATYTQPVTVKGPVRIFGGFDPITWAKVASRPVIESANVPVFVDAVSATTRLSFVRIHAQRTPLVPGSHAICIAKKSSTGTLSLTGCFLDADSAVAGAVGTAGSYGLNGGYGGDGYNGSAESSGGGSAGYGATNAWGCNGGAGGTGGYNGNGASGHWGTWLSTDWTQGGSGGANGQDCFDDGNAGGSGWIGGAAPNGASGAGGIAGAPGFAGQAGGHGAGGGGGGGGGGGYDGALCNGDRGGGGGGGGGGGQGGAPGTGGQAGGSTVGVLALGGSVNGDNASTVTTHVGGAGGQGGSGGWKGYGGGGGYGGTNGGSASESGPGGNGSPGGDGGFGGHGGGGGGGISAGVLRTSAVPSSMAGTTSVGAGGAGGPAAVPPFGAPNNGLVGDPGSAGNDVIAASSTLAPMYGTAHPPSGVQCRITCAFQTPSALKAALALDPDADVSASGYSLLATTVPGGTASMPGANQFKFTPNPGFFGWTSFPIRAADAGARTVDGYAVVYVAPPVCPVDVNSDGAITPADIAIFVNTWFTSLQNGTLAGDFDGNGAVQPADIAVFVGQWASALANGC